MPKDLPGLYWNEEKRRYFPVSSRPLGAATVTQPPHSQKRHSSQAASPSYPLKRHHALHEDEDEERLSFPSTMSGWRAFTSFSTSRGMSMHRRTHIHDIQKRQISTSISTPAAPTPPIQFDGPITALCSKNGDKMLVGDMTGWLYSVGTNDIDITGVREFGLRTQITSITRSGSVCMCGSDMVSSLGSPARLLITNDDSTRLWVLRQLPPHVCGDVWCGQVAGRKAVLGGNKALICFSDFERDEYIRLQRSSDVLAMCQRDEDTTFLGLRNGIVERWDSRQPGGKTDLFVNMSEKSRNRARTEGGNRAAASVDYLRAVHENQLLVRTMRGDLEAHDLRFLRDNMPVMQFEGLVPSFSSQLGITVDHGENFLFAGGGDASLHIWSLRTGQPLHQHTTRSLHMSSPLNAPPLGTSEPIRAMEIVDNKAGSFLWIAIANELNSIRLGPGGMLQ